MSVFSDFITSLETKLKGCSYINDPSNVLMGESLGLNSVTEDQFPRYEVLIDKEKWNGYISQRKVNVEFRFSICGFLFVPDDRYDDKRKFDNMRLVQDFASETRRLIFSFLDDRQAGTPPCEGFQMLGEFPEIFYDFEMFPNVIGFEARFSILVEIKDTEV